MEGRALYGPGSKEREKLQAAMASLVSGKRNIDVTSKASDQLWFKGYDD